MGVLLTDVRQAGTPTVYLAQLDVVTGQRVAFYALSSNTQTAVVPYDWQWVGDGTLLVCGKSTQLGLAGQQGYLARHDFRGTPLAASRPRAGLASGIGLWAYPNPAQGATTLQVSGLGRGPATVRVLDLAGRVVRTRPIAGNGDYPLDLAGLPPGLYVAQLYATVTDGQLLGTCKLLLVP
ncbi:T9SS type A sorting domain-containing protein [Hymenobacter antarcticus]|uniref:Secretion system C-terminal sorting domain-containing protein n=1 Tax=Hymenobacter antarcticus TaxID=486270 RepID=A0ABP7QQC0_9BACT